MLARSALIMGPVTGPGLVLPADLRLRISPLTAPLTSSLFPDIWSSHVLDERQAWPGPVWHASSPSRCRRAAWRCWWWRWRRAASEQRARWTAARASGASGLWSRPAPAECRPARSSGRRNLAGASELTTHIYIEQTLNSVSNSWLWRALKPLTGAVVDVLQQAPLIQASLSPRSMSRYLGLSGNHGRVTSWMRPGTALLARRYCQQCSLPRISLSVNSQ